MKITEPIKGSKKIGGRQFIYDHNSHRILAVIRMNKKTAQIFLLISIMFLLVSLTAVNATENNQTSAQDNNPTKIQQTSTQPQTQATTAQQETKKQENNKNQTNKEITKKQTTTQKNNDEKIDTTLTIKFINYPENEFTTDTHLQTHIDEEYTIDITLTEDQEDTPINDQIQLYHENTQQPDTIQLNQGHAQVTYTTTNIGEQEIYAQYQGNQQYNPTTSTPITLDSESYETTITLEEIQNQKINSTITVEGNLYYNENTPLPQATIIIKINNTQVATATTNTQGKYTTTISLENMPAQDFVQLTAQYNSPTDKYTDTNTNCHFDIERLTNNITLEETENNAVGTPVKIRGNTSNNYQGTISITITDDNDNTVYTNNTITTNNNIFQTEYLPTKAGTYHAQINASMDDNYKEETISYDFEVEIAFLYLQLEEFYESIVGNNVSITGCLVNENDDPMPNIPIEISTDDTILTTIITDAEGKFNYTQYQFTSINEDEFINIYFNIEETEDHDSLYDYVGYYLSRRNVNITVQADTMVKINQTLHINGSVEDSYNSSIPEGTISIHINNQEKQANIPIDQTGKYQTNINIHEDYLGQTELKIKAYFIPEHQDIYYTGNYAETNTTHEMIETRLEILADNTQVNKEVNITVRLQDEYENTLNETISLVVRNATYDIIYDEQLQLQDGTSTISITPENEGIHYIYAQYNGQENIYTQTNDEHEIIVTKTPTKISINNIELDQYVNDTITINGTLTTQDNIPLSNVNITLEIINTTTTNTTTIQVTNGQYTTTYTPKNNDTYTIRVSFTENNEYKGNHTITTFTANKRNTTVNINSLPTTIKYEDTITITGNVHDNQNNPANGSVEIWINNRHIDTQKLDNGQYTTQYNITDVGQNQELKVIFQENNAYKTSNNTKNYETQPLNTILNINPIDDTTINTSITINGTLQDENNKNIQGQLTVKINSQTLNEEITATDGFFQFEYTPDNVGTYNVNITFNPTQYYITSNSTQTFNSQKATYTLENITITQDNKENTIQVNMTLTANTNISTSNIPVTITIGEEDYTTYTDENGKITVETEKLVPDDYQISAHITETDYTESLEQNLETINIPKDTPNINLEEIIGAVYSENYEIRGNLTDSYGRPLNNTTLTITIADQTYETTTNENGTFKQQISQFNAGTNTISINVPETPYLNPTTLITTFQAEKQHTNIILNENNKIKPQDNLNITGQLTDKNNQPLTNKKITITVNNKKYTSITNQEGVFNITIKKAKLGTYKINATFTDENYYTSSAEKTVNVSKLQVNLVVEEVHSIVGEEVHLRAYLVDELGNNVTGGNLVFKINGRTLRMDDRFDTDTADVHKFSVRNGIVEYTLPAEQYLTGAREFTASYSGSSLYESAKSNTAGASIILRQAVINVTTQATQIKQHENITLKASIEDVTENITKSLVNNDSYVIFKVNDVTLKDENGNTIRVPVENNTATYNYSVGIKSSVDKDNNTRNYTVTAVYVNKNYASNTKNTTDFNVEKSEVNINITSIQVEDDILSIKANLTDYTGLNLEGENKICVKINGITYKEENINKYYYITDGIIDINDIDVKGISVKSVEIVTGERQSYYGARKTVTIETV